MLLSKGIHFLYYFTLCEFLTAAFHWTQNNNTSSLVYWAVLNILTDLTNAEVYMVLILPLVSNSFSLLPSLCGLFQRIAHNWYPLPLKFHRFFLVGLLSGNVQVFVFSLSFISILSFVEMTSDVK